GSEETNPQEEYIENELNQAKQKYKSQGYRFKSLREKLAEKEMMIRDSLQRVGSNEQLKKSSKGTFKTVKTVINVSKLKSIKYQFQQIEGIDKKVIDIQNIKGETYVLSADGFYLIKQLKAKKIWSKLFLQGFTYDQVNDCIWLYGLEGLYQLQLNGEALNKGLIKKVSSEVVRDLAIHKEFISLSNQNKLLTYKKGSDGNYQLEAEIQLSNPFSQNVNIYYQEGQLYVLKWDGIYLAKLPYDGLELVQSHDKEEVYYLKDNKNTLWLSKGGNWEIVNSDIVGEELKWLKILPSLSEIYRTQDRFIFFISDNMVLRLDTEKDFSIDQINSFIKGAYQSSSELIEGKNIKLEHDNNNLKVILSTPEYLFPEGVAYQYYVKDLMDGWSDWTGETKIEFPFIPTGNY
ncbi:MAG: hypothetical protein R3321_12255, partial [Nitrososphaeraceae archaeon]|nr:hypothetical protein [Nitrososphaeraceae archaeon]